MSTLTATPFRRLSAKTAALAYQSEIVLEDDIFYLSTTPFKLELPATFSGTGEILEKGAGIYTLTITPSRALTIDDIVRIPWIADWFDLGRLPTVLPETIPVDASYSEVSLFVEMEQSGKGQPIEMYELIYGGLNSDPSIIKQAFRYTSGNQEAYIIDPVTGVKKSFYPEPIHREEIEHTQDIARASLMLSVPKNNDIAKMFIPGTPALPFYVRVYKAFSMQEDVDGTAKVLDYLVMFSGRVSAVSFSAMEAKISCDPIYSAIKRQGLRRKYESGCSHVLYSPECGVKKADKAMIITGATFDEFGAVIHMNGAANFATKNHDIVNTTGIINIDVQLNEAGDKLDLVVKSGYFTGGMVRLNDGTYHLISRHGVDSITLLTHIVLDSTADKTLYNQDGSVRREAILNTDGTVKNLTLYPGCDHLFSTCKGRFSNVSNFGGFPYFTDANPFVGTHVPQGG